MVYNDASRAFIQAFMARRVMTYDEAEPILSAILSAQAGPNAAAPEVTPRIFQNFLTTANTNLSPYDFQIRSLPSQLSPEPPKQTRTIYYVLTNTTSDSLIQLATSHTPDEIAFLRRIIDAMFDTNNTKPRELCAVSAMDAVRLNRNPARNATQPVDGDNGEDAGGGANTQTGGGVGLSMREAEAALTSFCEEGWLERSSAGYYTLTIRALAELHQYLIDTYNIPDDDGDPASDEDSTASRARGQIVERIKTCHGCKELVTIGLRCNNLDCNIRLHDPCAEGYFRTNRTDKCPGCGGIWGGDCYVGERAAGGRVKLVQRLAKRISGPSVAAQLKGAAVKGKGKEKVSGTQNGKGKGPAASQGPGRRGKPKVIVEEEEDEDDEDEDGVGEEMDGQEEDEESD